MRRSVHQWRQLLTGVVLAGLGLFPIGVWAACSPYMGLATINEVSRAHPNNDAADDFVEIKLLDTSIPASVYNTWSLQICENSGTGCNTLSVSSFSTGGFPWLSVSGLNSVSQYLDFNRGTDILLRDGNGDEIDYVSTGGYEANRPACNFTYDTIADTDNSTRRVWRQPDGTGDWYTPSGNSEPPTDSTTNDDVPPDAPTLSVDDATVIAGGTATFTLTLSAAYSSDVAIQYETMDSTAIAGTDYTAASGTITILQGSTTVTVDVTTLAVGEGVYYLKLITADNASIIDQLGEGTINQPAVDHYFISYDGGATANDSTGITCEAAAVTVAAHDVNHSLATPASGTSIALATSTGVGYWSNADVGTITDNGNGTATYTFAGNDVVTLRLNHPQVAVNPNPVNIDINSGAADPGEIAGEDPNIQFFNTGFRFVDAADNPLIATQVAAQESASYFLQAVRTDTQTGSCVNLFANGSSVNLELAGECNNPLTCAGAQVNFTNNGNTTALATVDDNGTSGAASYATVNNILFGADSKAEFTFNYPDVGAMSLHARYNIPNADGTASGQFMLGSSNGFVVQPADLVITTVETPGGTPNPGTTSAGAGFAAAGDAFRVEVQARNALGNLTPNFGNEISAEGIILNVDSLVFPAGGNNGLLSNPAAFAATATAGEFANTTIAWSEVGSFTARAGVADGDYLGSGAVSGTASGTIGRFYPFNFVLASGLAANSCPAGGFSYLAQAALDVNYQIEARNASGAVTQNYDNASLGYVAGSISVHGENNNDGTDLTGRISVVPATWIGGVYAVNDAGALVARTTVAGNVVPDGPLSTTVLGLQINDSDGANFNTLDFKPADNNNCVADGDCDSKLLAGTLNLRFGRLRLQDVHGPESAPIPMVWQTEYWTGSEFVLNTDDHCTQLPLTAVSFVGATTTVDAANDTISVDVGGVTSVFDFADPNGAADCLSATDIGICDGKAGRAYGATGSVATYPIAVDLTALPHLQGDWNQNGSYDDAAHPTVYVRFQHYRGHDRVIYWREVLQ